MDFKKCLEAGLIKRNVESQKWVAKEVELSEKFLEQSEKIFKTGAFESTIMIAYTSIFHAARALLYNKGYIERSHYCVFTALLSFYGDDKQLCGEVKKANLIRESRHETTYGDKIVNREEAKFILKFTKEFLDVAATKLKK